MKCATQPQIRFTALASKQKMLWMKKILDDLRVSFLRWNNRILIDSLHLGTMQVKRKRETDGTFLLHDVYCKVERQISAVGAI